MLFQVLHTSSSRMRVHLAAASLTPNQADVLEYFVRKSPCVEKARVYERTGDMVVFFLPGMEEQAKERISEADFDDEKQKLMVPESTGREIERKYEEKLTFTVLGHFFRKLFFPVPLRTAWTVVTSIRYFKMGFDSLRKGKLEVPVLDASAIGASMLTGDFDTAASVMFLLHVGEILEEWTHKKSVDDLASTMSLRVDHVWKRTADGDNLVPISEIQAGDRIVVRMSEVIPMDGIVTEGEATVNQSSMTGESVPILKNADSLVYAGTVIEEGSICCRVTKVSGSGRYDQIVRMIEDSEKLKSATETRAFHLADRLVPWSLGGTIVTWLLTRNITRALSFLMVDFSCALKLSMPLTVLSAIREAGERDITVKGGKFLEAVALSDTIVFDKTGTLTYATPEVVKIVPFGGISKEEALRTAACLEEHYPHSIANAVVRKAKEEGISHEEMHTKPEYVVAHGIASRISSTNEKAVIGSWHFIFDHEKCVCTEEEKKVLESLPDEYSYLYMAIGGKLAAAIGISDPLREEAPAVVDALHALGFKKVCMMTGDNQRTAEAVAKKLRLDEFHAEVLPEDKAEFVQSEHAAGRRVVMIGDGINDTPALSEADAGVAVKGGAAITREVADITITSGGLWQLVYLRKLSMAMMKRIRGHYRFIMGFNGGLIALGVMGILPPATSSLLHNGSTVAIGIHSMTDLKTDPDDDEPGR